MLFLGELYRKLISLIESLDCTNREERKMLEIGMKAPEFSLPDQ